MRGRIARVVIYRKSAIEADSLELHTFKYPETKISFTVSQVDTEKPDSCMIKVFGISKETYSLIKSPVKGEYKEKQYVDIYYGREGEEHIAYSGVVTRSIYSFDGGSQTLTCLISKDISKYSNMAKSVSTTEPVTLGTALSLISKAYDYSIIIDKAINKDLLIGKISHSGTIGEALSVILSDKYSYYVNADSIRVYDINKKISREITLTMENGLLRYPTEDSSGEKIVINSILIPSLEAGIVINIPIDKYGYSKKDTGNYRSFTIGRYASSFSNGLGTSEMECGENEG